MPGRASVVVVISAAALLGAQIGPVLRTTHGVPVNAPSLGQHLHPLPTGAHPSSPTGHHHRKQPTHSFIQIPEEPLSVKMRTPS
jgi:hypothetical protein